MGEMINANELRIGNYVSDNFASDSFFAQVKKLDFTRCHYGNFHSCYSDLKPIPITEEWLLKFGFKVDYGCIILSTNRGVITIEEDLAEISSVITHNGFMAPCRYVHQLQNLYFALTGSELTVA